MVDRVHRMVYLYDQNDTRQGHCPEHLFLMYFLHALDKLVGQKRPHMFKRVQCPTTQEKVDTGIYVCNIMYMMSSQGFPPF